MHTSIHPSIIHLYLPTFIHPLSTHSCIHPQSTHLYNIHPHVSIFHLPIQQSIIHFSFITSTHPSLTHPSSCHSFIIHHPSIHRPSISISIHCPLIHPSTHHPSIPTPIHHPSVSKFIQSSFIHPSIPYIYPSIHHSSIHPSRHHPFIFTFIHPSISALHPTFLEAVPEGARPAHSSALLVQRHARVSQPAVSAGIEGGVLIGQAVVAHASQADLSSRSRAGSFSREKKTHKKRITSQQISGNFIREAAA